MSNIFGALVMAPWEFILYLAIALILGLLVCATCGLSQRSSSSPSQFYQQLVQSFVETQLSTLTCIHVGLLWIVIQFSVEDVVESRQNHSN